MAEEEQPKTLPEHATLDAIEQVILRISWLAQRQFVQLLDDERFNLTLTQFYTLLHLAQTNGECKMSDLAEATQQSAAALTGVVDRLLDKQLVERTRHERDRRQVMVQVTPRGLALIAAIKQARREQIYAALGHLSSADADRLLGLLEGVLTGMVRVLERSDTGRLA
ncbi:MAG: MarR family transcriptional regulator [Chloroflexus aggregans]|uniref:MarR family transcriptional regulator n=1 Tax=Chloroflexus aggregans TaxID=152260 RepID=A0A2J6X3E7_9CHLR|nr:MAG: MarR family transcriptional regulator [Chloroflexus aggregans]